MGNRISERVADFLKRYPPFNELTSKDLHRLSEAVEIIYKARGSYIFKEDDPMHPFFYVIQRGAVSLRKASDGQIIDICDEGDLFGLRPLMAGENYKLEAVIQEDSILYAIPIADFRPLILSYEEVGNFVIESFASNTRNPYLRFTTGELAGQLPAQFSGRAETPFTEILPIHPRKDLVFCTPDTPAQEVATLMTNNNVGSVLVLSEGLPQGIITDKDLRNRIVTGMLPIHAPAAQVMTSPVITYPSKMTITQAQLAMMKNGIGHLCLTEDGTTETPVVGILSKYDLMLALGNSPEVLLRAIKRSRKVKSLKPIRSRVEFLLKGYLENNIPMAITMKLISELNDACIKRVIELSLRKQGKPPAAFAWLAMGSQGRGEQLLHTDQDNALVFEDVSEGELEIVSLYFHQLAKRVNKGLKTIGYEYCPADMMASNPNWCKSLSAWKKTVTGWIHNPGKEEVLLSSIFFDFNYTFGTRALVTELSNHIFSDADSYPMFYYHLASGALQNPSPSGFFRQFLLEQDGEHKDFFDLKRRVLMPFTDAARVLILSHSVRSINNTAERFEKLAELEENNREFFLSCSYATKALLKFRTKQGLLHTDSGRFIALDTLSKEEKIKLKRTFKILKELQEMISIRFKVTSRVL
jgi:CBS domain-containing protein